VIGRTHELSEGIVVNSSFCTAASLQGAVVVKDGLFICTQLDIRFNKPDSTFDGFNISQQSIFREAPLIAPVCD
jgi:hypothetical protein